MELVGTPKTGKRRRNGGGWGTEGTNPSPATLFFGDALPGGRLVDLALGPLCARPFPFVERVEDAEAVESRRKREGLRAEEEAANKQRRERRLVQLATKAREKYETRRHSLSSPLSSSSMSISGSSSLSSTSLLLFLLCSSRSSPSSTASSPTGRNSVSFVQASPQGHLGSGRRRAAALHEPWRPWDEQAGQRIPCEERKRKKVEEGRLVSRGGTGQKEIRGYAMVATRCSQKERLGSQE